MAGDDHPDPDSASRDQNEATQHEFPASLTLIELLWLATKDEDRSSELDVRGEQVDADELRGSGPIDRERGVLTPADREFLLGRKEFDHRQTYTNTWQRIRDRVTNSLLDFAIIATQIDADQRDRIFDDLQATTRAECLGALISFLYAGLNRDEQEFEQRVADGVFLGELLVDLREGRSTGEIRDVDVSMTIERAPDIDHIYEKYLDGHPLSDSEIGALVRSGRLADDELEELPEFTRLAERPLFSPRLHRLLDEHDVSERRSTRSRGSDLGIVDNEQDG